MADTHASIFLSNSDGTGTEYGTTGANSGFNNYGVCETGASTAAKTVTVGSFYLKEGASVKVKFTATNTAANPTLNVNDLGAKPIYLNGAAVTVGSWLKANGTYEFVYNGNQFDLMSIVPMAGSGDQNKFLKGDGTWGTAGGDPGEVEVTTTFSNDGNTVTETYADESTKVTVYNANGSITETYPDGRVFLTTFASDGTITKVEVTS